jgi:ligand-binding sensor domain-containing protein/signal transduction histidine kinase
MANAYSGQRTARRSFLFLLVLGVCLPAVAATVQLSEYQKQEWQVEDGLPQSELRAITQVPGGPLLIATYGGVASFDGLHFTPIHVDAKDPAASEAVNALLVSRNGDLWIGTDDRGIIRRTAGVAINVSEQAGFYQERVRGLFEDSAGTIWAATHDGIERITVHGATQSVELLRQLGPVSGDIIAPFADDGEGGVFILTSSGLFHLTSGGLHRHFLGHHELHHTRTGDAVAISHDRNGILWVGLRDGLLRFTRSKAKGAVKTDWEYTQERVPGFSGPITTLLSDHQGNLWVGTFNQGLCRAAGSTFQCWSTQDGLADNNVRSLYEDDEHNLWVGLVSGGLARWRVATMIPLRDEPRALRQVSSAAVLEDHTGALWIGTWGQGLFRRKHGVIDAQFLPGNSAAIRTMAEDASGNVWIGTWFNGLFRYNGSGFQHFLLGRESLTDAVSALLTEKSGGLWVGTYTGLLHFPDGVPGENKGTLLLRDKLITCLARDQDGSILVGTSEGLYRVSDGDVHMIEGLSHPYVLSISMDDDRNIWVGTKGGGLDCLKGDHAFHLGTMSDIANYTIFSVLDDGKGFLWMATSHGIVRVKRLQLEELTEQKRKTLDYTLLGKDDGMPSSECVGIAQPSSARMNDGSLWFGTAKGLAHHDPDSDTVPPSQPAQLTGAILANARVDATDKLKLAPGLDDLVLLFNAQNLGDPSQMEFRYKLDGYDRDWTVTRSRGAHYRQLPPGHYRFLIDARNAGSTWNDKITSIAVYQQPYFYQAWWFYTLLCVVIISAAVRLFRWRLTRAKGELGVVLEERNRIAREWHDTLMAGFAAISWQLETTARLIGSETNPAAKACQLARDMVRHCQTEARRILWDLRDNEEATGPLSSALSNALTPLSAKEGVDMQLQVEGHEVVLAPVCVHHLVRIGQEAVTNALRHAVPNSIFVHLQYHSDWLSLSVKDDGCGFRAADKMAALHGHFGIPVMEERARKLGGSLRVETSAGHGTEILVHVPFQMQLQRG